MVGSCDSSYDAWKGDPESAVVAFRRSAIEQKNNVILLFKQSATIIPTFLKNANMF